MNPDPGSDHYVFHLALTQEELCDMLEFLNYAGAGFGYYVWKRLPSQDGKIVLQLDYDVFDNVTTALIFARKKAIAANDEAVIRRLEPFLDQLKADLERDLR